MKEYMNAGKNKKQNRRANMEDRFLFKAKRKRKDCKDCLKEEWVIGSYVHTNNGDYIVVPYNKSNPIGEGRIIEVIADTICQCTGLRDKNDNLIWENDVVAYWDTHSTENGQSEADCIGKIGWDDETVSFQVTNRLSAESYEVLDECSVIGNIFDNPELLENC